MDEKKEFQKELLQVALPVTLQCLLQSSFSVVDQIMTGQLGSENIAAIGLSGKFISIYSVVLSAIAAAAGIMIAQYTGKRDAEGTGKSIYTNLFSAFLLAAVFTGAGICCPERLMGLYTEDRSTVLIAAGYLRIYAVSFLPAAVVMILSAYLRCVQAAKIPLYSGICVAVLNTGLNYLLIFGKGGFPAMGARGAAWASVISQMIGCLTILLLFFRMYRVRKWEIPFVLISKKAETKQYISILMPILICEFFWSLGENVYTAIYGHIGTQALAAMTLTGPVQTLVIGALSGISQAAGVLVGKKLGADDADGAYKDAKRLMLTGLIGSLALAVFVAGISRYYVTIFPVEETVRRMAKQILFAYALIVSVKVQNMILGGGILRSGGKTGYVMAVDLIGTWLFGVPLGLFAAFVCRLPIAPVYLILSLEECVRLLISLFIFRRKKWMFSF